MSKKIVIVPVFCETHLIKLQIDNIFNTIDPDVVIYNEGMFPHGPESCTNMSGFKEKYTLNGQGKRGFDYPELQEVIFEAQSKYKDKKIILNEMEYDQNVKSASEHYVRACTNFKDVGVDLNEGDYIFPYEGDVFHHESAKDQIKNYINQLSPNQGFKSIWIDFVRNQYYAELNTLKPFFKNEEGRHRKICIRYGDVDYLTSTLRNFESQRYNNLFPTDLITFHYSWFRKGKYLELRFDQLNRPEYYWKCFSKGIDYIDELKYAKVCMKPDKNTTHRYAHILSIDHPNSIKKHENYIKDSVDVNDILSKGLVKEQSL